MKPRYRDTKCEFTLAPATLGYRPVVPRQENTPLDPDSDGDRDHEPPPPHHRCPCCCLLCRVCLRQHDCAPPGWRLQRLRGFGRSLRRV